MMSSIQVIQKSEQLDNNTTIYMEVVEIAIVINIVSKSSYDIAFATGTNNNTIY